MRLALFVSLVFGWACSVFGFGLDLVLVCVLLARCVFCGCCNMQKWCFLFCFVGWFLLLAILPAFGLLGYFDVFGFCLVWCFLLAWSVPCLVLG